MAWVGRLLLRSTYVIYRICVDICDAYVNTHLLLRSKSAISTQYYMSRQMRKGPLWLAAACWEIGNSDFDEGTRLSDVDATSATASVDMQQWAVDDDSACFKVSCSMCLVLIWANLDNQKQSYECLKWGQQMHRNTFSLFFCHNFVMTADFRFGFQWFALETFRHLIVWKMIFTKKIVIRAPSSSDGSYI